MAMENPEFVDDFPIKTSSYRHFHLPCLMTLEGNIDDQTIIFHAQTMIKPMIQPPFQHPYIWHLYLTSHL